MNFYCVTLVLMSALVSSQVLESCKRHAFPPSKNEKIPVEVLNLDLAPEERWTHIVKPRKQQIVNFINYVKGLVPFHMFGFMSTFLATGVSKLPFPYKEEIIGIADSLDVPLGEIFSCNIYYELSKLCTSIITQDSQGNIYHARNLDLGALLGWDRKTETWDIAELLRPLTVAVEFQSKGKTLYKTVQFAGAIGVFTGVSPGKFSFSLNSRSQKSYFAGPWTILKWLHSSHDEKQFASFWARDVLQKANNFQEAWDMLTHKPLLAPVYYILAGTKRNEGIIITRSITESIQERTLSAENWYVLQTNYDNWTKPPFYDDRRSPAKKCMNELRASDTSMLHPMELMFNVLSTMPVKNKATIYTALMLPKTGHMEVYNRTCPGICYPW